jgi:uncharacterized protein YbjT (DUF2867 family)
MEVAVVGGTGSVGALVVRELSERGDRVRVLSRRASGDLPAGATHHRVDLTTGEGLAEALAGVEAVVDAANDASRRAGDVLVEGGRRMLAAEQEAGIRHHVAISIVGCDRVPLGYYRVKVAQEQVITESQVPWSLLRASQFHTLIAYVFEAWERRRAIPTGNALIQPIAPEVVAKRLADAVHDGPGGRLPDIAGPEAQTLSELAAAWREQSSHRLLPVRLPMVGKLGRALREGGLTDPSAAAGGSTFEQWLASGRAPQAGS